MTEFEEFLEKYCTKHEISREEALTHVMIQNYKTYLEEKDKGIVEPYELQ